MLYVIGAGRRVCVQGFFAANARDQGRLCRTALSAVVLSTEALSSNIRGLRVREREADAAVLWDGEK